jgi:hypothetical protein
MAPGGTNVGSRPDIDAIKGGRLYKLSNGCNPESTPKSAREECDRFHRLKGEIATAKEATRLDGLAATVRTRKNTRPAPQSTNAQTAAIAAVLHIKQGDAAAWLYLFYAVVLELGVAGTMFGVELTKPAGREPEPVTAPIAKLTELEPMASADTAERPTVRTKTPPIIAGIQLIDPPRPKEVGDIRRFILACVPRERGDEFTWGVAYARYQRWCAENAFAPMELGEFFDEFAQVCRRANIRTEQRGSKYYCLDVKLAS